MGEFILKWPGRQNYFENNFWKRKFHSAPSAQRSNRDAGFLPLGELPLSNLWLRPPEAAGLC